MARQDKVSEFNSDDEDQAALDAAYEQMHGKSPKPKNDDVTPTEEENIDQDEDLEDDEAEKGDDSEDVDDDQEEQDEGLDDVLDDDESDAEELDDDLDTLDEEEESEKPQKVKLTPEQQKVVDQRIKRELKKVNRAERETSELKAQVDMLTRLITGQQQVGMPQNQGVPNFNFQPPAPPKPFEEMNELEKIQYGIQVNNAHQQAIQEAQAKEIQRQGRAQSFQSVIKKLRAHDDDPTIKKILDVDGEEYFPLASILALADYPNAPSIMRHLYKTSKGELQKLFAKPEPAQIAGTIRLAEKYNAERKSNFQKKVAEKKPVPPGKVKSAKLPKTTNGGKGPYDSNFLEGLSDEQYRKLMAKGY